MSGDEGGKGCRIESEAGVRREVLVNIRRCADIHLVEGHHPSRSVDFNDIEMNERAVHCGGEVTDDVGGRVLVHIVTECAVDFDRKMVDDIITNDVVGKR